MTEVRPADLIYGHLGDPIYDTESHQWRFPREPLLSQRIVPVGQLRAVLEASCLCIENVKPNAVERAQQAKDLSHSRPELLPAAGLFPRLAQVSEAVNLSTANYDPTFSDLIAYGQVANGSSSRTKARELPCMAVAAGPAGELLRVVILRKEQLGWEGRRAFGIQLLTAAGGEQGWWRGNGSPLQQLVFAADSDGHSGNRLAARYHGAISILQPVLRAGLMSPVTSAAQDFQLPASRIEVTHVAVISTHDEGGVPYADVTFNPWDSQQVATIDQAGACSVWDLVPPKRKHKALWTLTRVFRGHAQCSEEAVSQYSRLIADGWARISWITNFRTLLVVSRKSIRVHMLNVEPKAINVPDLALTQSADWILDAKRSLTNPKHMFAVTSTRLFWLDVSVTGDMEGTKNVLVTVTVLLSWVHYRSPEDLSLHLELRNETDDVIDGAENPSADVLVRSQITGLATVFNLKFITKEERAISASDPYILQVPHRQDGAERTIRSLPSIIPRVYSLSLQLLKYGSLYGHPASGIAQMYMNNGVKFFQLSVLYNDLSVSEGLYTRLPGGTQIDLHEPNVKIHARETRTPLRIQDLFITPNGIAHEESLRMMYLNSSDATSPQGLLTSSAEDMRTMNFTWLVDNISAIKSGLSNPQVQPGKITGQFERALEIIEENINARISSETAGVESLLELASISPFIADVDDATTGLSQLSDRLNRESVAAIDSLSAKKRMIRDIAGQICLAAHIFSLYVHASDLDRDALLRGADSTRSPTYNLSIRHNASASSLTTAKNEGRAVPSSSSRTPSSHVPADRDHLTSSSPRLAIPTPEPTTPTRTKSSVSSFPPEEDPASQRLRSLTNMTPQSALPTTVADILEQWTIGGDPNSYEWTPMRQTHTRDTEEDPHLQPLESRRAKRRKRMQERIEGWSSTHPLRQRAIGGSQPMPSRPLGSQPWQMADSSPAARTQNSIPNIMSQPLGGTDGNGKARGKKVKPKTPRPAGFR
ncbi:MAG: hypothetical protein Q9163_000416 [Psora crenata]